MCNRRQLASLENSLSIFLCGGMSQGSCVQFDNICIKLLVLFKSGIFGL